METNEARERYHVAKLALFNVRLLHAIQHDQRAEVRAILSELIKANGFSTPPSTVHQGTFLQMAYICLVWLWESTKRTPLEAALLASLPDVLKRFGVDLPTGADVVGERKLDDWKSVLRLMRNALSHGNVEITDTHFVFRDHDRYRKPPEKAPTALQLEWGCLGSLCEACIHAMSPLLWPPGP